VNKFFAELGQSVYEAWKAQNFSPAVFPELATQILTHRPPAKEVDVEALVRDFLLDEKQPFQTASGFGQPELVVFDHPRFYIQALFWMDGTTDIHQHMFSGAFHVLQGSSIHSEFGFEQAKTISAHLKIGNLRMRKTELLETGATRPIVSGPGHMHSLFHLDTPSLTVVVRTHTDAGSAPQFTYLPPHLAVDPYLDDTLTMRRKQLLDVLQAMDDPAYAGLVRAMVVDLDFERGFFILQNGFSYLREIGEWDETLAVFREKHGPGAKAVEPTLVEILRRDGIAAMRNHITEAEHRFFLALLLNVPTRRDILAMVRQRFGGRPEATILRWAEELVASSEAGAYLLDAKFPEEIKAGESEQEELLLGTFKSMLGRAGAGFAARTKGEQAMLRRALKDSCLGVLAE